MSVLWRILSVAALIVSAVLLILSILSVRKEQRVRPGLDLLRLGVTVVTTVLMARLLGVRTSEALMGLGFLIGLLLGIYEGLHLRVRFLGKGTFARRTILGVVAWGVGVVLVQAAGVIGRVGVADFGLALSFLGIGQVVGLLTGRWQTVLAARRATAGAAGVAALVALVLAGLLLPGLASPAAAADPVDIRDVMAGRVPGVAVEVRGNGRWYGASLSLTFANETGAPVAVMVPLGLQFVPAAEATQTMIGAGGETIEVPALGPGQTYVTEIQAFCGQKADDQPYGSDVFSAGEVVTGDLATLVRTINLSGSFDEDAQDAVWSLTDAYDISANPAATALMGGTGVGIAAPPLSQEWPWGRGEEESDHHHLSAGEGTRTSAVGMAGAAALLLTSLAGSGASPASLAAAWRGRGWRGVRDLAAGVRPGGASLPAWFDPAESLSQGRAGAALQQVPLKWRTAVQETVAERFDAEQVEQTAAAVRSALGAVDPATDPAAAVRGSPAAARLLDRLPGGARARIEEKILAGLQEERVCGAVDEALVAARRDRAVALLRNAIARRDGTGVQRVMAALEEKDRAGAWSRASQGLDFKPEDLEYPPPAPDGTVAAPAKLDLAADLDLEADLGEVVARSEEMKEVLSRLPAEARPKAEARLLERLKADRVNRWVEKLRNAGGAAPAAAGGSVLDVPEAQDLLGLLPPGLREEVGTAAAQVLDGEAAQHLANYARRMVEQDHAMDLLRAAVGLGDGDQADAVMEAVSAGLAAADQVELDGLVDRVTGGAGLAGLARSGVPAGPIHLTDHLTGEADLLGAVRRTAGVEEVLQRSGSLRSMVEADLVHSLETDRVSRAVQQAAARVDLGRLAAAELLTVLPDLPEVKEALDRLPAESRKEAYRILGERLEADGLEAAVAAVSRALHLDRAQQALLEAAAAEDLAMADAALAGLTPEEARAVEAGVFRA